MMTPEEKERFLSEVATTLELDLPFVWGSLTSIGPDSEGVPSTEFSTNWQGNTWQAAGMATALADFLRLAARPDMPGDGD